MKAFLAIVLTIPLLTACGSTETFETIQDEVAEIAAVRQEVQLDFPEEAAILTMEGENGSLYLCENYEMGMEVRKAGNIRQTVQEITGFDMEDITAIRTRRDETDRWNLVWSTVGESGSRLGRAVIVNDDRYHYALYVMADEEAVPELEETWNQILDSFSLG